MTAEQIIGLIGIAVVAPFAMYWLLVAILWGGTLLLAFIEGGGMKGKR